MTRWLQAGQRRRNRKNAEYRKVRGGALKEHEAAFKAERQAGDQGREICHTKNRLYDAQMLHESKLQEIKDRKHEAYT